MIKMGHATQNCAFLKILPVARVPRDQELTMLIVETTFGKRSAAVNNFSTFCLKLLPEPVVMFLSENLSATGILHL